MKGLALVGALWLIAAATANAQQPRAPTSRDSQTIVFVCEHGTVKSVLALAYFAQFARAKGLPFRAVSRGTAPDSALPAFIIAGLRRDGLPIGEFRPTRFSGRDLVSAIGVISFDQPNIASAVAGRVPTIAWDRLPSVTANYAVARDSIKQRVAALVDSLARVSWQRP